MSLPSNTTELQAILDMVNDLPEAGSGGGVGPATQNIHLQNNNNYGISCSYYSVNYPAWVELKPGEELRDVVPEGTVYGVLYDDDELSVTATPAVPPAYRMLQLQGGSCSRPVVDHPANSIRLFSVQPGVEQRFLIQ